MRQSSCMESDPAAGTRCKIWPLLDPRRPQRGFLNQSKFDRRCSRLELVGQEPHGYRPGVGEGGLGAGTRNKLGTFG